MDGLEGVGLMPASTTLNSPIVTLVVHGLLQLEARMGASRQLHWQSWVVYNKEPVAIRKQKVAKGEPA